MTAGTTGPPDSTAVPAAPTPATPRTGRVVARIRDTLPVLGLFLLVAFFSLRSEFFLDAFNIQNLVTDAATLMLCAYGMTFVILVGEIDLSVAAGVSLLSIVFAKLLVADLGWPLAVCGVLAAGALFGMVNGLLTELGRIPSFIVTLGTASVATGLAYIVTGSVAVSIVDDTVLDLFYFRTLLGLPVPLYLVAAAFTVCLFVLRRTVFGRELYALGENPTAARLSGVRVRRARIVVFVGMGVLVGLGAVLAAARLGSGTPESSPALTLDAIAAVVIGGARLTGGRAALTRTLLGALLIAVLNNGLTLLNVNTYYQFVIKGAIILVAVLLDRNATEANR